MSIFGPSPPGDEAPTTRQLRVSFRTKEEILTQGGREGGREGMGSDEEVLGRGRKGEEKGENVGERGSETSGRGLGSRSRRVLVYLGKDYELTLANAPVLTSSRSRCS